MDTVDDEAQHRDLARVDAIVRCQPERIDIRIVMTQRGERPDRQPLRSMPVEACKHVGGLGGQVVGRIADLRLTPHIEFEMVAGFAGDLVGQPGDPSGRIE